MNASRFFVLLVSFLTFFVCCSSTEKVFQKHKVFCADIIRSGYLIYNTGADSILAEDQYQTMINDLSEMSEKLRYWHSEIQGK